MDENIPWKQGAVAGKIHASTAATFWEPIRNPSPMDSSAVFLMPIDVMLSTRKWLDAKEARLSEEKDSDGVFVDHALAVCPNLEVLNVTNNAVFGGPPYKSLEVLVCNSDVDVTRFPNLKRLIVGEHARFITSQRDQKQADLLAISLNIPTVHIHCNNDIVRTLKLLPSLPRCTALRSLTFAGTPCAHDIGRWLVYVRYTLLQSRVTSVTFACDSERLQEAARKITRELKARDGNKS